MVFAAQYSQRFRYGVGVMKKKKKKAKRWLSWRFRPFRLTVTIWIILIAIPVFRTGLRTFFDIEIFWYFDFHEFICMEPFVVALLLSYVTPLLWIRKTHRFWMPQIIKANFLVLLFFGILLLVMVALSWAIPKGTFPLATAEMDDHIYRLGYTESYPGFFIQLFKCDQIGLFCTRVCENRISSMIRSKDQFGLDTDAQTHTVFLTFYGEPICSHSDY
jgi:hypothetical protein